MPMIGLPVRRGESYEDSLEFIAFAVCKKMHSFDTDVEADSIARAECFSLCQPWTTSSMSVAFNPKIAVGTEVLD